MSKTAEETPNQIFVNDFEIIKYGDGFYFSYLEILQKDDTEKLLNEIVNRYNSTSLQLAEKEKTLKIRGVKIIEDAVKILTLEHQIKGHQFENTSLKQEIEGLKKEIEQYILMLKIIEVENHPNNIKNNRSV